MSLGFEPLDWQEDFICDEQPYREAYRGRGAGKTMALLMKAAYHAEKYDRSSVGLFYVDWPALTHAFDLLMPWAEEAGAGVRRLDMTIRLPNESVIMFGYQQRVEGQVRACNYSLIGVDDADLWGPMWPLVWDEGEEVYVYSRDWYILQMSLRRNREAKNVPLIFRTMYST